MKSIGAAALAGAAPLRAESQRREDVQWMPRDAQPNILLVMRDQMWGDALSRNVVPVTLPAGTTPLLLKVCNGEGQWGFVFRITHAGGRPLRNLRYSVAPLE